MELEKQNAKNVQSEHFNFFINSINYRFTPSMTLPESTHNAEYQIQY